MNQILTDAEITLIIRECARGSAINRDGSTSHRIARAIEQAILNKLSEQEPVSQVTCQIYGHVVGACDACNTHAENDVNETNKILADNYLKLTCGAAPSVPEGYQLAPIEPTEVMIAAGRQLGDASYGDIYKAMLSAARSE